LDRSTVALSWRKGPIFANIISGRRDQPRLTQDPVGLVGSDAGKAGQRSEKARQCVLPERVSWVMLLLKTLSNIERGIVSARSLEAQLDRFILPNAHRLVTRAWKRTTGILAPPAANAATGRALPCARGQADARLDTRHDPCRRDGACPPGPGALHCRHRHATRQDRRVAVGASPRGSLAFLKMARAHAALEGRDYVIPMTSNGSLCPSSATDLSCSRSTG